MSRQIKLTIGDDVLPDMERVAAYRFGTGHSSLSEYIKLAAVQLMRRDLPMASKGAKTPATTVDE